MTFLAQVLPALSTTLPPTWWNRYQMCGWPAHVVLFITLILLTQVVRTKASQNTQLAIFTLSWLPFVFGLAHMCFVFISASQELKDLSDGRQVLSDPAVVGALHTCLFGTIGTLTLLGLFALCCCRKLAGWLDTSIMSVFLLYMLIRRSIERKKHCQTSQHP